MRAVVVIGQSPGDGRDEAFQFADFECVAHFDGACEPVNPGGHGGWGYVIRAVEDTRLGAELAAASGYIPAGRHTTNNVAEYTGALEAVRAWVSLQRSTPLLVCGDSKLVIMQMRGAWQVKQGAYVPVYRQLRALVDAHALAVKWQWVPRDQNARADELSKIELVKRGIPIAYRPKA
jgi:ribonuclease HI